MCQYRYYYYAGCRHQRTVLTKYCANATSIALAPSQTEDRNNSPGTPTTAHSAGDDVESAQDEVTSASSLPDMSTTSTLPSSSPDTTTTNDSHISHRHYTLSSIPKLTLNVTSLQSEHIPRRHSDTDIDSMAPLPALTKSHWRQPHQIVLGTPAMAHSEHDWVVLEHDVLGSHEPVHIHKYDVNVESHTSVDNGHESVQTQIRRYEQEISRLHDMLREQENGDVDHATLTGPKQGIETVAIEGCTSLSDSSHSSPAALLQRQHEKAQLQQSCLEDVTMLDAPEVPLCDHNFPDLEHVELSSRLEHHNNDPVARKPSYADMASQRTTTLADVLHTNPTCSCTVSREIAIPRTSQTSSPTIAQSQASPAMLKGPTPQKSSPRFAQPTAAFSRRADETLRKDGATIAVIVSKNGLSKPASVSAAGHRQQKRKSLPGDWLTSSLERTDIPLASKPEVTCGHALQQSEASRANRQPRLRKKTSTYMSPTKAATQRTMATIGQENAPPQSLRLQRNLTKLDTVSVSGFVVESSQGSPASPDTTIETEMRSGGTLRPQPRSLELSSVTTRRRSTISAALPHSRQLPANTSIVELLAQQAKAAGLPMVANTVTKRRGSHGHLLIPIKAKLDKIGILRDDPHAANVRKDSHLLSPISQKSEPELFSPLTRAMQAIQAELPRIDANASQPEPAPVPKKAVVAPHVRAAMREAAERKAAAGSAAVDKPMPKTLTLRATAQEFRPMSELPRQESVHSQPAIHQPQQGMPTMVGVPAPAAKSSMVYPQSQIIHPLATTPPQSAMRHSVVILPTCELPISNDDATRFYSEEQWSAMPYWQRRQITERRSQIRGGSGRYHSHFENGLGVANGSVGSPISPHAPHSLSAMCPDVFGPKPVNVQAGQILVPHIDPTTQNLRWILQPENDLRRTNESAGDSTFDTSPHCAASVSPGSSYNSPRFISPRTPGPLPRSWTIGSEQTRQVYGWKGGDGREIKFVGHGPDAEREPGHGVRFNYQRRGSNMGRGPRMIGENDGDGSPEAPLAPRSRRHWAQLAGYTKQPCDTMEIVDAIEQMPAPSGAPLYGHCRNCAVSSH
ncbi:hypothetical protein Slin14017_G104930 [Septoria linicola]|nr:hypothetical protein Slin14017_G104930 [Septoria linicola]